MSSISRKIANVFGITSDKGVTAIEYGLIAALIAMAIIAAITLVGTNLGTTFNHIAANVSH